MEGKTRVTLSTYIDRRLSIHLCARQTACAVVAAAIPSGNRQWIKRRDAMLEVESFNERIREYDRRIERMAKETYPETALLEQVKGVGNLIATAYVLTIKEASIPQES